MTNDADVVVITGSFAEYEGLIDRLAGFGFTRTNMPPRLRHATGGLLDVLPYSELHVSE